MTDTVADEEIPFDEAAYTLMPAGSQTIGFKCIDMGSQTLVTIGSKCMDMGTQTLEDETQTKETQTTIGSKCVDMGIQTLEDETQTKETQTYWLDSPLVIMPKTGKRRNGSSKQKAK